MRIWATLGNLYRIAAVLGLLGLDSAGFSRVEIDIRFTAVTISF